MNSRLAFRKKKNHQRQKGTWHNNKIVNQENVILNVYTELQIQKQNKEEKQTNLPL